MVARSFTSMNTDNHPESIREPLEADSRHHVRAGDKTTLSTNLTRTTSRTAAVVVDGASHVFVAPDGRPTVAIQDVSLTVREGEFVSIVGPSGCGKTTVLNMVAGLIKPTRGMVQVNGKPCDTPRRDVGYMFARDGLMPWRTALSNVEYGLELRGVDRKEREQAAIELIRQVGLVGFEKAHPAQLSQGMRQRIAMARTLAIDPGLMLLDEPFAALDAQTRTRLQVEFTRIWEQLGKTIILVTHDLQEAVALSDRVLVMNGSPGRIVASVDVPLDRPRDLEALPFREHFRIISEQVWSALKEGVRTEQDQPKESRAD